MWLASRYVTIVTMSGECDTVLDQYTDLKVSAGSQLATAALFYCMSVTVTIRSG